MEWVIVGEGLGQGWDGMGWIQFELCVLLYELDYFIQSELVRVGR